MMSRHFAKYYFACGIAIAIMACTTPDQELIGDCEIGEPRATAQLSAGKQDDGSHILHTGKRIAPYGTGIEVGTFPIGAAVNSQGTLAVINNGLRDEFLPDRVAKLGITDVSINWQAVEFFNTDGTLDYTLPIRSSFVGIAWHANATSLYVAGGGRDVVRRVNYTPSATTKAVEDATWPLFGYPTGLALAPDDSRLYVTLLHRHALVALDPVTGAEVARYETEANPYAVVINQQHTKAYVSNWNADTISVIDLSKPNDPKASQHIVVGKNPEGLALSKDGKTLYVAVSDDDSIAVVDTGSLAVSHFDLKHEPTDAEGLSPVDVQLTPDGKTLLVVIANQNAVIALDPSTGARFGAIPTAAYPTEVEISADGKRLHYVSAKGYGAGPNIDGQFVGAMIRGTVHTGPMPDNAGWQSNDKNVRAYNDIMQNIYSPSCATVKNPVPVQWGEPSQVIEHVVYVMRENKTYDSLLGDLGPDAKGDPSLAVFGEEITPNLHALARRFGNLTNFYNESEQSVQGHIWGSAGFVNDFAEKTWIAMWGRNGEAQVIVPGMEPATLPKRGDLFRHFINNGKSVRNMGEYMGVVLDAMGETTNITSTKFPAYFGVDDARKMQDFVHELDSGRLDDFTFILLGNDHTLGRSPGSPTPEYMVADNDVATGMVVEAISKSHYWKNTVIFVFEDDPQGNADHIDAHRSIALVISPWTKRGAQSHVRHSFPSLHKTTSMILGVPPLSKLYQEAAGMYEVFDTKPDNIEPYTVIPSNIPYATNPSVKEAAAISPKMERLARESLAMDFSGYDRAPKLGRLLWEYRMGERPFPEHLVSYEEEDDDEEHDDD